MKRKYPDSELIINADGSCFHLHIRPEQLAERIILVSDPATVTLVGSFFEVKECDIESREFHSITGTYKDKRITCLSYGFGSENIDIVLNELDTLANVDYKTREEKEKHVVLTLVNIGISEGIQDSIKSGSIIVSTKGVGLDGLLNFYADRNKVCDHLMEKAFTEHMKWNPIKGSPYVVTADKKLMKQFTKESIICGYTVSCIGYYSPQGRGLRLPLEDAYLKEKLASFKYDETHILNIDMESASILGMASLLGHRALSCSIVTEPSQSMHITPKDPFFSLIQLVLDRI